MPTLPLYSTPSVPTARHHVLAPGGYEWWRFDAEDESGALRVVIDLFEGFVLDPAYLQHHARFLRKPTRTAPPVPGKHLGLSLGFYRLNNVGTRYTVALAPPAEVTQEESVLHVGRNTVSTDADGTIQLQVLHGPLLTQDGSRMNVEINLAFRPRAKDAVAQVRQPLLATPRGEHFLTLDGTAYDVEGTLNPARLAHRTGRLHSFRGRGYRTHRFGTEPPASACERWMNGHVQWESGAADFSMTQPKPGAAESIRLAEIGEAGVRETQFDRPRDKGKDTVVDGLSFPPILKIGDSLELRDPRIVHRSPGSLSLSYAARAGERTGRAMCEVVSPVRLPNGAALDL